MSGLKPNVLLILCDQFRGDCIAASGNKEIITPNLDRLVNEGTNFSRAYTPSPVCVPARNSMFWGLYPSSTGVCDNDRTFIPLSANIMETLGRNGYYRHGIGKMHFAVDPNGLNGFSKRERQEEILDTPENDEYLQNLLNKGYARVFDVHGQRSEMYYIPQISILPQQDHPTNWVGDRSVAFLREYDRSEPFFLMSSFIHPHPPFSPPASWNKMYKVSNMAHPNIPDNYNDLLVYINHLQNRYKYRDNGTDRNLVRTIRAFYYACISFVDYQVGRIIDELESKGLIDNTLIIFTSDHGEMLGDYNSFGKRCMLDPSVKIPLIIRYPKLFSYGSVCDTPVNLVDLFPTIMNVADVDVSDMDLDGVDLYKICNDTSDREYIFSQYSDNQNGLYMAVSKYGKYIHSSPDNRNLYFDYRISTEEQTDHSVKADSVVYAEKAKSALLDFLEKKLPDAVEEGNFKEYPLLKIPSDEDACLIRQDHMWCSDIEKDMPDGYPLSIEVS